MFENLLTKGANLLVMLNVFLIPIWFIEMYSVFISPSSIIFSLFWFLLSLFFFITYLKRIEYISELQEKYLGKDIFGFGLTIRGMTPGFTILIFFTSFIWFLGNIIPISFIQYISHLLGL